jgi:hypothetical protein
MQSFDFGFTGDVVTPVLCEEHGIVEADTGLKAWDDGWASQKRDAYPCPECGAASPVWDRRTCPNCGKKSMRIDWDAGPLMWD